MLLQDLECLSRSGSARDAVPAGVSDELSSLVQVRLKFRSLEKLFWEIRVFLVSQC